MSSNNYSFHFWRLSKKKAFNSELLGVSYFTIVKVNSQNAVTSSTNNENLSGSWSRNATQVDQVKLCYDILLYFQAIPIKIPIAKGLKNRESLSFGKSYCARFIENIIWFLEISNKTLKDSKKTRTGLGWNCLKPAKSYFAKLSKTILLHLIVGNSKWGYSIVSNSKNKNLVWQVLFGKSCLARREPTKAIL